MSSASMSLPAPDPTPGRPAPAPRWWQRRTASVLVRVLCAVFGGYALSAACVALFAPLAASLLGITRSDAVVLSAMLGFVFYLLLLLWAFAQRRLARVMLVLAAGPLLAWAVLLWS
jgi:hypothetical protein